uniref:Uncharacterized protein n=1 Tax=Brassica oleracea TaxID=3712 RepID=A0A3P6AV65_BRAOL|nr:unnamed protein product [Brassica oleracea]
MFAWQYYLYYLIECWANNERVREALHVKKGTKGHWQRCNWTIPYNHDIISSVPYHMNISLSEYRSLIYSGDHDITMPFLGTQAWIKSLNYSIIDDWRPWKIKDQIAGYTRTYSNKMTFATIKESILHFDYRGVDTRQSINQTRHLSCSKGGSVDILCKRIHGFTYNDH